MIRCSEVWKIEFLRKHAPMQRLDVSAARIGRVFHLRLPARNREHLVSGHFFHFQSLHQPDCGSIPKLHPHQPTALKVSLSSNVRISRSLPRGLRPSLAAKSKTYGTGNDFCNLSRVSSRRRCRLVFRAATHCSQTFRICPPQRRARIGPAGAAVVVTHTLLLHDQGCFGAREAVDEACISTTSTASPLKRFAFLFSPC